MSLTRFDDLKEARARIEACISAYGWTPEHVYSAFVHAAEEGWQGVFFESDEGYGLIAYWIEEDSAWNTQTDPLAPPDARGKILAEFLTYIFSLPETESVYLQCASETRKDMLAGLSKTLRVRRTSEKFLWPVLNLRTYDSALAGPHMKSMRNVRNRFLREHTLQIVSAETVPPKDLHPIVEAWKKNRPARHRAYSAEYHALIDDHFAGTTDATAFLVDGKPEALSAGWPIPNSDSYYHSLALHTYMYWGLGEMLMLESLALMKKGGYASANLGGSDAKLLAFKKKFGEVEVYTTEYFSVVRRESD